MKMRHPFFRVHSCPVLVFASSATYCLCSDTKNLRTIAHASGLLCFIKIRVSGDCSVAFFKDALLGK